MKFYGECGTVAQIDRQFDDDVSFKGIVTYCDYCEKNHFFSTKRSGDKK
jgi:hypothetical protein